MAELKCIFCDVKVPGTVKVDEELFSIGEGNGFYQVHCYMCGAKGPVKGTEKGAIDAWNKRSK